MNIQSIQSVQSNRSNRTNQPINQPNRPNFGMNIRPASLGSFADGLKSEYRSSFLKAIEDASDQFLELAFSNGTRPWAKLDYANGDNPRLSVFIPNSGAKLDNGIQYSDTIENGLNLEPHILVARIIDSGKSLIRAIKDGNWTNLKPDRLEEAEAKHFLDVASKLAT